MRRTFLPDIAPLPRVFSDDATRAGFKEQWPVRAFSSGADMGQAAWTIVIVTMALCSGAVVMLAFPGDGHKNDDLLAGDGRRYDFVCVCVCVCVGFCDSVLNIQIPRRRSDSRTYSKRLRS